MMLCLGLQCRLHSTQLHAAALRLSTEVSFVVIIADDYRQVRAKGEFHSRSISTVAFKNVKFHI